VRFGIKGGYKRVQLALLFSEDEPSPHYLPPHLTDKEIDLSTLVATGMKNKEIGPAVGATEYAIKNCLCVVYDKIGVSGRTELALWWKVYGKAYSQKKGSKCATFTT
jgi:DNA-binding NarL/FixJ family response regulator